MRTLFLSFCINFTIKFLLLCNIITITVHIWKYFFKDLDKTEKINQ